MLIHYTLVMLIIMPGTRQVTVVCMQRAQELTMIYYIIMSIALRLSSHCSMLIVIIILTQVVSNHMDCWSLAGFQLSSSLVHLVHKCLHPTDQPKHTIRKRDRTGNIIAHIIIVHWNQLYFFRPTEFGQSDRQVTCYTRLPNTCKYKQTQPPHYVYKAML